MSTTTARIAVIGSGAAAFACAVRAAREQVSTVLIESETLGGTCVNVGCIPSKALIRAAAAAHTMQRHPFAGIEQRAPRVDAQALLRQRAELVNRLRTRKYADVLASADSVQLLHGRARFRDAHTLVVEEPNAETVHVEAEQVLIASGAHAHVPDIPGLVHTPYWTAEQALSAEAVPRHLLILGSSTVAVEFAQAYRRLGAAVTVLARGKLLSREEPQLAAVLKERFAAEGIGVHEHCPVSAVEHQDGEFRLQTAAGRIGGDRLLVAAGRCANTAALGLKPIGVDTDARGRIHVDRHLRTSREHIFAAGDCTTLPRYVYVAAAAGTHAAVNMLGGNAVLDLDTVPAVTFVDPQLASVGLTEAEAGARGIAVETRTLPLDQVPRALVDFESRGMVKLVAEAGSGRLLGAQIAADQAGEVIQCAALAMRAGLRVRDLASGLFPYLTMSESLKLCAQTFDQDLSQLSCCAG